MASPHEFEVGNVHIGSGELFLIAGPCVIESEGHALKIAEAVTAIAREMHVPYIFKASFDKANRTSLKSFRGPGIKEGARILAVTFYRGAEVISPTLTVEQREAYLRAINKAVDHINANFGRYAHYIVEPTKGQLVPEELSRNFIRYGHVQLYEPEVFTQAYAWMQSWGLSKGKGDHDTLVVG